MSPIFGVTITSIYSDFLQLMRREQSWSPRHTKKPDTRLQRADSGELDNLVTTANLLEKYSQARRRFVTEQQAMQFQSELPGRKKAKSEQRFVALVVCMTDAFPAACSRIQAQRTFD
jgi:hypothetical protein